MTDLNKFVAANADDGHCETDGSSYNNNALTVRMGLQSGNLFHAFLRFTAVTIPKDSIISSCILRFIADGAAGTDTVRVKLHFEDADNPTAPTDGADVIARSLTTGVDWDFTTNWTDEGSYDTIDFASELQTVVNRSGWASGQAVVANIVDDGSDAGAFRAWESRNQSSTQCAQIRITYTESIAPDVNELINITESTTVVLETLPNNVNVNETVTVSESVTVALDLGPIDVSETINLTDAVTDLIVAGPIEPNLSETLEVSESVTVALDTLIDELWLSPIKENAKERYYCTLTGTADATTDIEIPISSFQARKRTGESTFLSVVVPDYVGQTAAIAARPNGEVYIELALILNGVETVREEILRVDLEDIQPATGGRNRSIILTGHKTQTFTRSIMTLSDSIYRTVVGGFITHRFAKCDPYLNPGDVVTIGDDTITVDYVTYTVAQGYKSMEIKEA